MPAAELIEKVEVVTPERVQACAERILRGAAPSVVIVGGGRKGAKHAETAAAALRAVAGG